MKPKATETSQPASTIPSLSFTDVDLEPVGRDEASRNTVMDTEPMSPVSEPARPVVPMAPTAVPPPQPTAVPAQVSLRVAIIGIAVCLVIGLIAGVVMGSAWGRPHHVAEQRDPATADHDATMQALRTIISAYTKQANDMAELQRALGVMSGDVKAIKASQADLDTARQRMEQRIRGRFAGDSTSP